MLEDVQSSLLDQYHSFLVQSEREHSDGKFLAIGAPPGYAPPNRNEEPIPNVARPAIPIPTPAASQQLVDDIEQLQARLTGTIL
jgi:hypothetical protein